MSTSASLVVGVDGSTTKFGSSRGVSSKADRTVFLERRRRFDAILIGGNTARSEPYNFSPVPLIVISRSTINPLPENLNMHLWNTSAAQAISRARSEFGERILVEAGVGIVKELLAEKLLDEFFLTVTPEKDGENIINWKEILSKFEHVEKSEIDTTLFFHAYN
jgi:riboflavin biosynthesis pyrimidine reductase